MHIGNPITALATAWVRARDYDLPEVVSKWQGRKHVHRPNEDQLDMRMFGQSWPNTLAGMDAHDGLAGQAFCSAYTVVVIHGKAACVYFNGQLTYRVEGRNAAFREDLKACNLASQRTAISRYGAELPLATPTTGQ
jgi:hypothetical protein